MLYIDFDGVILDTAVPLFEEWRKNPNRHNLSEEEKIKYIQKTDWNYVLYNSEIISDSIYYLNQMNPEKSSILTKIHSLENEGAAKVKWIRDKNIKQNIILVPYMLNKSDIVPVKGNTLVDDSLKNLEDWENNNGYPIFFDMDNDNYDSWHQPNNKGYQKVLNLSKLK